MSAKRKARKLLTLMVVIAVLLAWNGAVSQNEHTHEQTEEPRVSGSASVSGSNVAAREIKHQFGNTIIYVPGQYNQPVYSLAIPVGVTFKGTIDENAPSWEVKL
jgi:hypothetical protein